MLTFTKINDVHYDIIDDDLNNICVGQLCLWPDGWWFNPNCEYVYDWKDLLDISNKLKELNNA